MLTIFNRKNRRHRFCDGVTRRSFLQIGGLAVGGLTLPQLLAAEAQAKGGKSHKSVIMIFLCGGPPHQDMYDIKVDAPAEIRGPFDPIKTSVPGIEICELLPKLAGIMDKLVPIRTIVGCRDDHAGYQCYTGHLSQNEPAGGWPHIGAAASKFLGPVHSGIPPYASLCYTTQHKPYNEPGPGFLGLGHSSFRPTGPGRDDLVLNGIDGSRLGDRRQLLSSVDRFRRSFDASGAMDGMDAFTQRAMGILTSSDLFAALDITKEDPKTIARYGTGDYKVPQGDGAPRVPQNLLLARRLVEAGARVVTVNYSFWDWHGQNFNTAKRELPIFDQAVSALVEDLHERGLDKDCTVIAWGEFGRTPKINPGAGRDHWAPLSTLALAGGGLNMGQVVGESAEKVDVPKTRPISPQDLMATIFHVLGIDRRIQYLSTGGRPTYMIEDGKPIEELV